MTSTVIDIDDEIKRSDSVFHVRDLGVTCPVTQSLKDVNIG